LFHSLGEYGKAQEYLEKALAVRKEIGDKKGEAADYGNLGTVFRSLGEYGKSKEYLGKALAINKEIGDRNGEASSYVNLGTVLDSLGEYGKAQEYHKKGLAITKEIGNREGEASCHGNLGAVFHSLGEYEKAQEYFEKALAMGKEIGNRELEASCYGNLGTVFRSLGEYGKARKYYNEALGISKDSGNVEAEIRIQANLAFSNVMEGDTEETLSNLLDCVNKFENMRVLIKEYDELKIFVSDEHATPFRILSEVLCAIGNPTEALCVEELRRGRALAELLSAKYCVESQVSGNLLSWVDIERIIGQGKNAFASTFLTFLIAFFCGISNLRKRHCLYDK